MASKKDYKLYKMEYTILTDFSDENLNCMMNVTQKHSGKGSYYPYVPVDLDTVVPGFTTMERDFCLNDPSFREYAQPNNCSLSWVTMIINAGERAMASSDIMAPFAQFFVPIKSDDLSA